MSSLEILSPGAYASIQDLGRRGLRRIGVPWSGALDPWLMRLANVLAGRDEAAPVIECFEAGLHLAARGGPMRLALAGPAELEIVAGSARRALAPWRSVTLAEDEELRVKGLTAGRLAMVAVAGLALPPVLGSASTYARAKLGGWQGRPLAAGDRTALQAWPDGPERELPAPPKAESGRIRVVLGPQAEHFDAETLARFLSSEYRVGGAADRMGLRLEGPVLSHAGAAEIVSDATVPGSVQVPGNGLPIVLLADAQTAGGYPKIATVVTADLPRLAALRPGQGLRFAAVSVEEGERLARAAEARIQALLGAIRTRAEGGADLAERAPDGAALYSANLVGGVVDALDPGGDEA